MIEYRSREGTGYMTDTAIFGGDNVADILFSRRTCRIITMAFCTVINSTAVIEHTVFEIGADTMAYTAILAVRDRVIRCHSQGASCNIIHAAIMAGSAITGDAGMTEN